MEKLRVLPLMVYALFQPFPQSALGSNFWQLPENSTAASSFAERNNFVDLIDQVVTAFQPAAAKNNATISYEINWNSSGAGAFTLRRNGGREWHIIFYDGITRLPYVTDGLIVMIACHEIGHHIAGYPFKENGWAAAEGQADYFTTHACLPKLWQAEPQNNLGFRDRLNPTVRSWCEAAFTSQERRNICFRTGFAMEAARLYEGNGKSNSPRFETPDRSKVPETLLAHPRPQCRVDTQIAGMLCTIPFNIFRIPGLVSGGLNTLEAEQDSNQFVCNAQQKSDRHLNGNRPRCWFASLEAHNED